MHDAEVGRLHASLIKLACGLGKTLCTLMFILKTNEMQRRLTATNPEIPQKYAATLICCPGGSVAVWQADIAKFYPNVFTIHQFYGNESNVTNSMVKKTLVTPSTTDRLQKILRDLDPNDPKVSHPLLNVFSNFSF